MEKKKQPSTPLPPEAERILATIPNEQNRGTLRRYSAQMLSSVKLATVRNVLSDLRDLALSLGETTFEDSGRDEIATFLLQGGRGVGGPRVRRGAPVKYADSTLSKRKSIVRAFYKWIGKAEEVAWVKPRRKSKPSVQAEDLLTREEVGRMLDAARTTRDKTIIALLAESGFRLGELAALRVGSITATDDGAIRVTLPEAEGLKTGRRSVLLFDCAGLVLAWLDREHGARAWKTSASAHERAAWEDLPLFHSWDVRKPLRKGAIYDVVKRTAKRAGIKKRVKPHLFRFGAATSLARAQMPVGALAKRMGWSDQSRHVMYYSRLAESDADDWERKRRGLLPADDAAFTGSIVKPIICPRCGFQDRPGARYCGRCARPLSHDAETDAAQRKRDEMKTFIAEEIRRALGSDGARGA